MMMFLYPGQRAVSIIISQICFTLNFLFYFQPMICVDTFLSSPFVFLLTNIDFLIHANHLVQSFELVCKSLFNCFVPCEGNCALQFLCSLLLQSRACLQALAGPPVSFPFIKEGL